MDCKDQKKMWKSGMTLLACLSFALFSCSDDEKKVYVYSPHVSYAVSMGEASDGNIMTDKGNVLVPDESSVGHDLTDGERVFVNCSVLEREDEHTYRVRINKYYQLLTKEMVRASASDDEELGNDPVEVKAAWFGGGYLNVRLGLEYNPSSGTSHLINMVYDDVKSTSDTLYLTLRHNAFADTVRTEIGTATASFNLENVVGETTKEKVYVRLRWQWYAPGGRLVTWEDKGYYYTSSTEEGEESGEPDETENSVDIQ